VKRTPAASLRKRSAKTLPLQIEKRPGTLSILRYSRLIKELQSTCAKIFESHLRPGLKVELILSKPEEVRTLNKHYRGKDKTTDVLSFESGVNNLLGSIVIDLETAKLQAREYKHSLEREVLELCVHGIFHLLGYDHENHADAAMMKHYELFWVKRSKL